MEALRTLNGLLYEFTQRDGRLVSIDLSSVMLGADGKPRQELLGPDGLHLESSGLRTVDRGHSTSSELIRNRHGASRAAAAALDLLQQVGIIALRHWGSGQAESIGAYTLQGEHTLLPGDPGHTAFVALIQMVDVVHD